MIDQTNLKSAGWQRVVAELASGAPDDRSYFERLMRVLAQVSAARKGVLMSPTRSEGDEIEPRIVIPMHYALPGQRSFTSDLAPLEKFTHEIGMKEIVEEEKLTVTSANLPSEDEQTRFVIMKPSI